MGKAEWGAEPEFFGPRHAHREGRILHALRRSPSRDGLHLECAAGVGSLSVALAGDGRSVVAADMSLRSLAVLRNKTKHSPGAVLPVVADITCLPFEQHTFASATTAETLEHVPDDRAAVAELARVLAVGGLLVGTVPAGPEQWSDWDEWAGHLRRYTVAEMLQSLHAAELEAEVVCWGWPILRLYDDFFLKRVNRRRLHNEGPVQDDATLRTVSGLGRRLWLVRLVRRIFDLDRLFDGTRWGVGILFKATKAGARGPG